MRAPIEEFSQRRGFYFRDNFRRMVRLCFFMLLVDSALLGYIFYQTYTMPVADVYVSTHSGELIPLISSEDPDRAFLARPVINVDAI
ncbi:MAG: hypothetical protein CMF48_06250 [Legionellales bacterium]|nr:hypothetical protein [Legionellales bacterium]